MKETPESLRAQARAIIADAVSAAMLGIFCSSERRRLRANVKKARKEADELEKRAKELEATEDA